jgi:hypothetical protein
MVTLQSIHSNYTYKSRGKDNDHNSDGSQTNHRNEEMKFVALWKVQALQFDFTAPSCEEQYENGLILSSLIFWVLRMCSLFDVGGLLPNHTALQPTRSCSS